MMAIVEIKVRFPFLFPFGFSSTPAVLQLNRACYGRESERRTNGGANCSDYICHAVSYDSVISQAKNENGEMSNCLLINA